MSYSRFALVALAALGLSACGDKPVPKQERGLRYMPDMYVSPALKAQEGMTLHETDADGKAIVREVPAMMMPPLGTVPRDGQVYTVGLTDWDAADKVLNPLVADAATLRLGRDKYEQFCVVCHGRDGNAANGYVASRLLGVPSLNTDTVAGYADGRIHHIVTVGRGRMPNYAAQLLPEERWAVVHYVRALYAATKGKDQAWPEGEAFVPLPEPLTPAQRQARPTAP